MRWYQRFFRRDLTEKQLDAELRFHLEQQIADFLAAGMDPQEARRRASLEFGGLDRTKEKCREAGSAHFIDSCFRMCATACASFGVAPDSPLLLFSRWLLVSAPTLLSSAQ